MPLILALLAAACSEPRAAPNPLFRTDQTGLGEADKAAVLATFSEYFARSADGTRFEDPLCGDLLPESEIVDLNGDGTAEVFVQFGNSCTSGMAGRSLGLLTKASGGKYKLEFAFPAGGWAALDKGPAGWADLSLIGPGFCHAVWTRTTTDYEFKCNLPEIPDGCAEFENVCQ